MRNMKEHYHTTVKPNLKTKLNATNDHQVTKLIKMVINVGLGDAAQNAKLLDEALQHITLITGQKPLVTRAKKSIAGFKVRENMPVGAKVTLRGDRMYLFLNKLVGVVLPRIRDFRGLNPNGFDGRGNYNIGLREQLIFPEIDYDMVNRIRGMNITLVTSAENDQEALDLLLELGLPIKKPASATMAS
jgi:large subunit ribosomal protein L5